MKKIALILVIAIFSACFSCCGTDESFAPVSEAVKNINAKQRYTANYLTEMTFEKDTAIMLFKQGSFSIDREEQSLYSKGVQSYFANSSQLTEMFYDGIVYTDLDGIKSKYEIAAEEYFSNLYYEKALEFDEDNVDKLTKDTNSSGTLYKFTVENGYEDRLWTILGKDGIYNLAKISKPQTEKTHFSEIDCEYTITQNENDEPLLASYQLIFTVFLYDTPPYSPGYTPPEKDYMIELKIRIKVSYTSFGEDVLIEIPNVNEYSELK